MKNSRRLAATSPDEICGDSGNAGLFEDRVERLELVVGGEDGAADQPSQVRALADQAVERFQRSGDGVCLAVVLGESEQGGRVAPGYARNDIAMFSQGSIIPLGRDAP